MDETKKAQGNRLVQARLAYPGGGLENAVEAAKRLRVPYPTYKCHEGGSRGFKRVASRYANFYKVRLGWLWTGEEPMRQNGRNPLTEKIENLEPDNLVALVRVLDGLISAQKQPDK